MMSLRTFPVTVVVASGLFCSCSNGSGSSAVKVDGGVDSLVAVVEEWTWAPGKIVPDSLLSPGDTSAYFQSLPLDSAMIEYMTGKSLRASCPVPASDLRYLKILHVDFNGATRTGELVCNRLIADDLLYIFRRLYDESYPIEGVRTVDLFDGDDELSMEANNTSCFNSRGIGGGSKLSRHAYGMAVDINPKYNPLVKERNGKLIVEPAVSGEFVDRSGDFPYKIDRLDLCYRLFTERGFRWGGSWRSVKDYQHFEK